MGEYGIARVQSQLGWHVTSRNLVKAYGRLCAVAPYEGTEVPGIIHCPDSKAFLGAVKWCVENKDEVRDLAREARGYVLDERTVEANISTWKDAICPTNA